MELERVRKKKKEKIKNSVFNFLGYDGVVFYSFFFWVEVRKEICCYWNKFFYIYFIYLLGVIKGSRYFYR